MSATLSNPQISAAISASLGSSSGPASTNTNIQHSIAKQRTVGTAAGNVNKVYSAAFTVDTGTPITIDLTTAADPQGNAQNFGTVYDIIIENSSSTTGQIMTLFGGSNGLVATGTLLLNPGGAIAYTGGSVGITVDSTHKLIQISVAAGTGVAGRITVLGK